MSGRTYDKKKAPNKHKVLDIIYKDTSRTLRGVDSTILLGSYPTKAVHRVIKYISRNNTINGWEVDEKTWAKLKQRGTFDKLLKIVNEVGHRDCQLLLNNTNVRSGCTNRFEDLDFCLCWTHKKQKSHHKSNDPYAILTRRLYIQRHYLSGPKAMVGTVSLRNGKGKAFSFKCLNDMLTVLGWNLLSIDGKDDGYNRGTRVPGSGSLRKDGRIFHAYEHNVEINRKDFDAVDEVKMRMFTYTDTAPMLTFSINYR